MIKPIYSMCVYVCTQLLHYFKDARHGKICPLDVDFPWKNNYMFCSTEQTVNKFIQMLQLIKSTMNKKYINIDFNLCSLQKSATGF